MVARFKIDYYVMDLVGQGAYAMIHVGQTSIPDSIETMPYFIDGLHISLTMQELLHKSAQKLYRHLVNPGLSKHPSFKDSFR